MLKSCIRTVGRTPRQLPVILLSLIHTAGGAIAAMTDLKAKNITLNQVYHLLKLEEQFSKHSFTSLLLLEALTEFEKQEIAQIRSDFRWYLNAGKVLEGQVKLLVLAPLLRLAGFYRHPIQITLLAGYC